MLSNAQKIVYSAHLLAAKCQGQGRVLCAVLKAGEWSGEWSGARVLGGSRVSKHSAGIHANIAELCNHYHEDDWFMPLYLYSPVRVMESPVTLQ